LTSQCTLAEIKVAFASTDSLETTAALKEGLRVGFPVYAELDMEATAQATGAFYRTEGLACLHATGFLIKPDGTVATSTYSTGPIGRMQPTEVLRSVLFQRSQS